MTPPDAPRRSRRGVARGVAGGLEVVVRDWLGRVALFVALVLVAFAALGPDIDAGLRVAGVVVGLVVGAAVVLGWWRKAPGVVQWVVAVVGAVVTVALLLLVIRT